MKPMLLRGIAAGILITSETKWRALEYKYENKNPNPDDITFSITFKQRFLNENSMWVHNGQDVLGKNNKGLL
jgi:hypothetical protein